MICNFYICEQSGTNPLYRSATVIFHLFPLNFRMQAGWLHAAGRMSFSDIPFFLSFEKKKKKIRRTYSVRPEIYRELGLLIVSA